MTLKGNYSGLATYDIGDVVCFQDVFYLKNSNAAAGTYPTETKAWERLGKMASLAAKFAMDMSADVANNLTTETAGKVLDARQGKALKDLIDGLDERVTALEGDDT